MLTIPQYTFIAAVLTFTLSGLFIGYWLGLRETKRRLKAHKEVTDRMMNTGISRSYSPFTATGIRDQIKALGGYAMQNPVIYSPKIEHFDIFGKVVRLGAQQLKEEPDAKN